MVNGVLIKKQWDEKLCVVLFNVKCEVLNG